MTAFSYSLKISIYDTRNWKLTTSGSVLCIYQDELDSSGFVFIFNFPSEDVMRRAHFHKCILYVRIWIYCTACDYCTVQTIFRVSLISEEYFSVDNQFDTINPFKDIDWEASIILFFMKSPNKVLVITWVRKLSTDFVLSGDFVLAEG